MTPLLTLIPAAIPGPPCAHDCLCWSNQGNAVVSVVELSVHAVLSRSGSNCKYIMVRTGGTGYEGGRGWDEGLFGCTGLQVNNPFLQLVSPL